MAKKDVNFTVTTVASKKLKGLLDILKCIKTP